MKADSDRPLIFIDSIALIVVLKKVLSDVNTRAAMKSEVNICRYNACKKIAQLNKVIQYLRFHLDEREYQLRFLRAREAAQTEQLCDDLKSSIAGILTGFADAQLETQRQTRFICDQKLDTLQTALDHKRRMAERDVRSVEATLEAEVENARVQIKELNTSLSQQIAFWNDQTKSDLSNIQKTITQKNADFQAELKDHEFEAKKKMKEIDEQSSKKLKEIEARAKEELQNCWKASGERPLEELQREKYLLAKKNQVFFLKKRITESAAFVRQQQRVFQEHLDNFRREFGSALTEYRKESAACAHALDLKKSETEAELMRIDGKLKTLRRQGSAKKEVLQNEVIGLRNERQIVFDTLTNEFCKRRRSIEYESTCSNNVLAELRENCARELRSLTAAHAESKAARLNALEQITSSRNEVSRLIDMAESIDSVRNRQQREIEDIHRLFEADMTIENEHFRKNTDRLEDEIRRAAEASAEKIKALQERRRLQAILDSQTRAFESAMHQLDLQIDEDLKAARQTCNDQLFSLTSEQNEAAEALARSSDNRISDLRSLFQAEFETGKAEHEQTHRDELEALVRAFSDGEVDLLNAKLSQTGAALAAELASVVIPDRPPRDDSIHVLSTHLRDLPVTVTEERVALIKQFENESEEEDSRHRQSLFAHLYRPTAEQIPSVDRSKVEIISQELSELSRELLSLQVHAPVTHFESDPDDEEQQRLRKLLEELRAAKRRKVRDEREVTAGIVRDLTLQIEQETAAVKSEEQKETEEFETVERADKEEYERNRSRRRALAKCTEESEQVLHIQHGEMKNQQAREFAEAVDAHGPLFADAQRRFQTAQGQWESEEAEDQVRLEKEYRELQLELAGELAEFTKLPFEADSQLDVQIAEKTKIRNRTRDQFLHKPMRREEHAIIQRLERTLAIKTQQLATIGKELLGYRHQLIIQEDEYNCRFGVDPSVAVLGPKGPEKARPATSTAHRLPRLSASGSAQ
jgi:hypothetical protein